MFPTPETARDNAAAVFEGRVSEIQHEETTGAAGIGFNVVKLQLVRTWKGVENQETVEVRTNDSSAACGITFEKDKSYLVYATQGEHGFEAHSCGRTREMSAASEDLAALGGGVTPVKVDAPAAPEKAEPPKVKSGGCGSTSASSSSASAALLLPGLGLTLSRRRRR
jgi:MYXO-CTERM domain-containing protein